LTVEPPSECDVVVVGAGIVGLAVARELGRRHEGARIAVLEREATIGAHQTSHSSGVIHAGVYYEPGSLKARLCVEGAAELYLYCEQQGIEARRTGKLIVATAEDELGRLDELERRATANGVPGLRRVDAAGILEIEPHARGLSGLHSPATGVVDFAEVAAAFAREVEAGGGIVCTACAATSVETGGDGAVTVRYAGGVTRARAVVACAGAWSDRLARAAGAPADPRIVPFRGGYLRLRPERSELVRANIYPVPDPELPFLGAHLTRGPDGAVLLGPTALMVGARDAYRPWRLRRADLGETLAWPGTRRLIARHWRAGLRELLYAASKRAYVRSARRLVPELRAADFVAGPAGIRAQALAADGTLVDDFVVSRVGAAIFIRNAPSPAATSSLPLARLIADQAGDLLE
jgi:(S)-2-hydroxyglutarate dehydrogenase